MTTSVLINDAQTGFSVGSTQAVSDQQALTWIGQRWAVLADAVARDPLTAQELQTSPSDGLSAAEVAAFRAGVSGAGKRIMAVIGHSFMARGFFRDRNISVGSTDAVYQNGPMSPIIGAMGKLGWPVQIPGPYIFAQSGGLYVNIAPDGSNPAYQCYDGSIANGMRECVTTLLSFPSRGLPLPGWCYCSSPVNDVVKTTTGAQIAALAITQWDRLLAAGINLIVDLIDPAGGPGGYGGYAQNMIDANRRLRGYYAGNNRVIIVDAYWLNLDQTKMGTSDYPSHRTDWSTDGLHKNGVGAHVHAEQILAPALAGNWPFNNPADFTLSGHPTDTFNATTNPLGNRFVNTQFTGTGGVKSAGSGSITGNVPNSYYFEHQDAGTGSATISVTTRAILLPNGTASGLNETVFQMVLTNAGATNDKWWLHQLTGNRGPANTYPEKGFWMAAEVDVSAGAVGLLQVGMRTFAVGNSSPALGADAHCGSASYVTLSADYAFPNTAWRRTLRSVDKRLLSSTDFYLDQGIEVIVAPGGSASVRIGRLISASSPPGTILSDGSFA